MSKYSKIGLIPTGKKSTENHKNKAKCDMCGKEYAIHSLILYKGRYLCRNCLPKEFRFPHIKTFDKEKQEIFKRIVNEKSREVKDKVNYIQITERGCKEK